MKIERRTRASLGWRALARAALIAVALTTVALGCETGSSAEPAMLTVGDVGEEMPVRAETAGAVEAEPLADGRAGAGSDDLLEGALAAAPADPGLVSGLGAPGGGGRAGPSAHAGEVPDSPSVAAAPPMRPREVGAAPTGRPQIASPDPQLRGVRPTLPAAVAPTATPAAPPRTTIAPATQMPTAIAALPQSGVLQTTFVGGSGATARLEDLLDRGVVVGGEHVRLEAFDDLGRLPYPVPGDDAVAVYANLERAELVSDGERVHLQIALLARQGELPVRPRMDVRLVIDRSGSMSGDKWTHAIAAAHALVDRLAPTDTFGLISYSDDATMDLAASRVGDRRASHAAIDRLVIGGGTNIDGALELAERNAPSRHRANDVLMVVLLSDGVANVGQTNADLIATRARSLFDADGILTTTVGVGTDFDEQTMLSIAREGSGSYHFVRRSEDIARILTDELEERAQAVAQNVRLRIELAPGVVATRVYGSRLLDEAQTAQVRATEVATDVRLERQLGIVRDRQADDQRGLRMHFSTFRRGDQHVVLMELAVPPGTDLTSVAQVSLDWKDLVHERNDHAAIAVTARRTSDRDAAVASTDRHVKRTVLAFQAGDALQETARSLERGDVAGARLALSERIDLLRTASTLWRDRALDQDVRILEQYQRVLGAAWPTFDGGSQHTLVLAMNYYGDRRMQ